MLVYSAMAGNPSSPDYDLADRIALTTPAQVRALSHPLRTTILGLLHERAATVTELAVALERPKSASTAGRRGCSTSGSSGARTATRFPATSTTSRSQPGSRQRRTRAGSC